MGKLFSGKVRWLINIFIIILVGFTLFLVTVYNDSIKQLTAKQFNIYAGKVLGDMISLPETQAVNPKEKQRELLTYAVIAVRNGAINTAIPLTNQLMQVRIGDIINSYSQIKRFSQDTQSIRKIVMEKLREFAK